jgi:hypothetical protein
MARNLVSKFFQFHFLFQFHFIKSHFIKFHFRKMAALEASLRAALESTTSYPLAATDTRLVDLARRSVCGSSLSERLLSASITTYGISRILRLTASSIVLYVNEIIVKVETDPMFILANPNPTHLLYEVFRLKAVNSEEFMGRIQKIYTLRPSPEFPELMSDTQVAEFLSELKTLFLDPLQNQIECTILVATSFRSALQFAMKMVGDIAATTLNKWAHGAISSALNLDLGPINHELVTSEAAAFLFGMTYEYNSNELEFNRMSATISHYLALHLDKDSPVIQSWRSLWTPTALQTAIGLESTNTDRPWATQLKYMVSYADRTNITNVLALSELTYCLHVDYESVLNGDDRVAAARLIVDLMRCQGFLHVFRITRSVQENEASPLYGYALYPYTVTSPQVYDSWPSVCARIRKALRDRETVEALLTQIRAAITSETLSEVEVPRGTSDTLMVEDWEDGELAVALNGDRRPEFLVRVADYERMLLHGTAENPFDRQEVKTVEVVRMRLL